MRLSYAPSTLYFAIRTFVFLFLTFVSCNSFALATFTLPQSEWRLISVPADPGSSGTVENIFADDLPASDYGTSGKWVLFTYDGDSNSYQELAIDDALQANTAYWIIQLVEASVEIDAPDSLAELTGGGAPGCPADTNCVTKALAATGADQTWNMVGFSSELDRSLSDTVIHSANSACSSGCTLADAASASLTAASFIRYTGTAYENVAPTESLLPWEGYWFEIKAAASSPVWVIPISTVISEPPVPPEVNAARLLMQASFGPTEVEIDEIVDAGGPVAWVDQQMALPIQRHLPVALNNVAESNDFQEGRLYAYWERSLRAKDQLRQRVALALSEILVVSDNNDLIEAHSSMTADYFDILLEHSFGNFRDLLWDVTLSPTMGVWLSMLGNDKPDNATGRRADENYARELMQLFTIGLVGLNMDGTERPDDITYNQDDVENLARIFTGWSWDIGEWSANSRSGWRPDPQTLYKPMVAYEDHHDKDAKTFLGESFPAGQSAQAELNRALDILFNHPNVGPFIGKQLIMRLVTSNPSRDYVRRIAQTFNDDGNGVRGDLAAVVRAILLDSEARDLNVASRTDFGKLREPMIRYTHLMRAFQVPETPRMKKWKTRQVPQLAPLTSPSVFNFFQPDFAPSGAIADAGMVAPEFQISSESNLNTINSTLNRMLIDEMLLWDNPVTPNINKELGMLNDPTALIDHLDLLLTAGSLTDASRQVIENYISENRGKMDDDRLVKDVIALCINSSEFAVQR